MTRVLLLTDQFWSAQGGTEQHIIFLLRQLPRDSVAVQFGVLSNLRSGESIPSDITAMRLYDERPTRVISTWRSFRRLVRFIREQKIDVVHAFCRRSELVSVFATRLAGHGRVLGVRRNIGYWHTFRTLLTARFLQMFGARYAANCHAAKDFAVNKEWIGSDRITVIPNPLAAYRLEEGARGDFALDSLGLSPDDVIVAMVANVRPVKDHLTMLQAIRKIVETRPNTKFLFVGDQEPTYFASLQKSVAELGIEKHIRWLGVIANPFTVLRHVDIAVLSSTSEGLSNSLIEYSAAGLPTVATNVGGAAEIVVDGETGYLVPPRSPDALAERITQLIDDPALRQLMGQRAQARARETFSEDSVIHRYNDLYQSLVAGA